MFTASEVETASLGMGVNPAFAGLLGGMTGGVAQAYATMGKFSTAYIFTPFPCHRTCCLLNRSYLLSAYYYTLNSTLR